MFQRILVPIDGTTHSNRAVKAAAKLARSNGGELTIFHAVPEYHTPRYVDGYSFSWPPEPVYLRQSSATAAKLLAKAKAVASAEKVPVSIAQAHSDAPAKAILEAARKAKVDSIVMASHGRSGLEKLLLGSETQKVLSKSKLPVLVVR